MNVKSISVIIPNYNGRSLLEQTIPPLIDALNKVGIVHEIIVADDCSTDDSVGYLHHTFKDIIVLQNAKNAGFAITVNKGIFTAKHSHLLLLNSDVKLSEDYFIHQLRYFDKQDTFGVMGRIIGWDNDMIQDGGKYPYFHGAKIKTSGNYIPLNPSTDSWLYSMYLSGANAFVDREKIMMLKGFNEIFSPYYIEDYELSLRAWRLGWKCYYEHFAICRHRTSSTIKSHKKKSDVRVIYNRNKMYLHAIHLNGMVEFLWYLQLTGELLLHILRFRFYYLKSFFIFLNSGKKIAESRKEYSNLSRVLHTNLGIMQVVKNITFYLAKVPIKRIYLF